MTYLPDLLFIIFFFAFGACVGSFLNVVVWRVPRGESIVSPPSHCPKCNTKLAWYDNIPVFGWLALGGKCRYCKSPISARYPIIEAITGLIFVGYYVGMFIFQKGPCSPRPMTVDQDWPLYVMNMLLIASLLASSLIDAEHFIIPVEITWVVAGIGFVVHAITDTPSTPGSLNATANVGAISAGASIGLIISIILLQLKVLPLSFAEGGPLMEIEKARLEAEIASAKARGQKMEEAPVIEFTRAQLRGEMQKEMLFLMPPLLLGGLFLLLYMKVPALTSFWDSLMAYHWLSGLLGSLWGALVGAFIIWFTRIAGTIGFGREAMGMGDVHLMFGIGAVIGALGATIVFFLAPFAGILFALQKLIFRKGRELPYGPFLSLATAFVVLFYCQILERLAPSIEPLRFGLGQMAGGTP